MTQAVEARCNFKHINDSFGHAAGDRLLKSLAKRLKRSVRSGDFVACLGGDEFAVIVEGEFGCPQLLRMGEAILERLRELVKLPGRVVSAGASIGGAIFPIDADSANELFNSADTALYALKEAGRGGTKMFHSQLRDQANRVASQLRVARTAITAETVEPHYQPKVDLKSGRVLGSEALLRWDHANGLQRPDAVS